MVVRRYTGVLLVLALMPVSTLCAETQFGVQVGAFKNEADAAEVAVRAEKNGFEPVTVQAEQVGDRGLFYKVIVGAFTTRPDANDAKSSLASEGLKGFVRTLESYDVEAVREAINPSDVQRGYFAPPSTISKLTAEDTSSTEQIVAAREAILKDDTTSTENLAAYKDLIISLSDHDAAKGREIVRLGYLAGKGRSVYKRETQVFSAVQPLLKQVANGEIAGSDYARIAAQEQVAHHLHYYQRNYPEALAAYRQILAEHLEAKRYAKAAQARREIAATSYELAKASGFDRAELQVVIGQYWADAVASQEPYLSEDSIPAADLRQSTCRIGLMLSEIMMEQKNWQDAREVAQSIVEIYASWPHLAGERAEAYCHLAKIGINLNDKELCHDSIEKAIALGNQADKIWGDERRDPVWKAWALRNVASYHFNEPQEVRDQIKADMFRLFTGNPGLKKYFGEDAK